MLVAGSRLGPYEIVAPLGSGGMGEVYRARDTRLDRTVAIKILHADLAGQAELRARLEREARAVSSLNHPHICTLYDIGSHDGVDYLVMEHLEGEALDARLKKGALPLDQALAIGVQVADALDRAHRAGIVHRDLKPGNVVLTKGGAKLLDFGLAKVAGVVSKGRGSAPQALRQLTQEGAILGTIQYMAPEQLHGREADARSDLFAFGAMLYEMITGAPAFTGESPASVIAAILEHEPRPMGELAPIAPPALERTVRQCLVKDPDERWQSAGDVKRELAWIAAGGGAAEIAPRSTGARERVAWTLAGVAALAAAGAIAAYLTTPAPRKPEPIRLELTRPVLAPFHFFQGAVVAPDGSRVAFVGATESGARNLWVRELASAAPRELTGTDGAEQPFWSPDGRFLAYFSEGKLRRIDAAGGPPQVICAAEDSYGGAWGRDGTIVFGGGGVAPLMRVAASGGAPAPATQLGPKEEAHRWPCFLPDGRHFVFMGDANLTEEHHLKLGSLDSLESRDLLQAVSNVVYAEPGYLLYVRGGMLLAQPFDARTQAVSGDPVPIAEEIQLTAENHRFEFSAGGGVLTYRRASPLTELAWFDRQGKRIETVGPPQRYGDVDLSPDGKSLAYNLRDADGRSEDLWILDLARKTSSRVTTNPAGDRVPVWSPGGDRIAFSSYRSGNGDLYLTSGSAPGGESLLLAPGHESWPCAWTPDGKQLVYEIFAGQSGEDLWIVSLDDPSQPRALIASPTSEGRARISPDGRWLVYASDDTGRTEVFVQPFPPTGERRRVSITGGDLARWTRDGAELVYVAADDTVMSCAVRTGTTLEIDDPVPLFPTIGMLCAVAGDGQRFLQVVRLEAEFPVPLSVVLDWTAVLPRR